MLALASIRIGDGSTFTLALRLERGLPARVAGPSIKVFAPTTSYGTPITKQWAERSTLNTVATEIAQVKGASGTLPSLSPTDEFADYENYFLHRLGSGGVDGKISGSYVRQGLTTGIDFQEKLGANPYKFAIVGGADSHNALQPNDKFDYFGPHGNTDKTPDAYPLTLNALTQACNQKTSRAPVMHLEVGDVGHAVNELRDRGLIHASFSGRTERYDHKMASNYHLNRQEQALICALMLRGPQTEGELRTNAGRVLLS